MSEKIVQLNEEVIKGQLKELVRGSVQASNIGYTFGCLHEGLGKRLGVRCGGQPPQRRGHITPRYCSTTWFGDFMPRQGFQILLDRR